MTAAPVLARNLKYSVTISRGEGAGKVISYEKPIVTIGRGPENDLVFANDPKISRTHAELRVRLGQLYIKNLSDRNFILVNGERVDQKFLTGSSEIQIGDTVLLVKVDTEPAKSNYLSLANPQGEKNSLAQAGFSQSIAKSNTSADF